MKPRTNFSTLFCLILVSRILAQDQSISRQINDITFTCEYFPQQGVRVQVISFSADGSNHTAVYENEGMTRYTATATFNVTPSEEKAAYCKVGDISTDLVYFGGECIKCVQIIL